MAPLRAVAVAALALAVATTLQGCKKKVERPPIEHKQEEHEPEEHKPQEHEPQEHKPEEHKHVEREAPKGRFAVDGSPCEHTWKAKWADHTTSLCRASCCYHRSRRTHTRSQHSFCRVREHGHEILKMCRPASALADLAAEVVTEQTALTLAVAEAGDGGADIAEEDAEDEQGEAEGLASIVQSLGVLPLFACSAGFAAGVIAVFLVLRPRRLRTAAGSDEQYAPFIES